MPSESAAVGCSEKSTKEFSFQAFPFKNEARNWQGQVAMNRWDLATKKWEQKQHDVLCSKLHRSHTAEHSVWAQIHVCRGVHWVTNLEKIPVRISEDEAPMPLPVVGLLFISLLSFHFSWALLGAWRFGLFRCVYSSFHNRLDLIREPAFYSAFYFIFPIHPCLSYVMMKNFCLF